MDKTTDKASGEYRFSRQHTQITCAYTNQTDSVQIIRISNIEGWHFERTVFSGQQMLFETVPEAVLEVSTGEMMTAVVRDRIPCLRLRAAEPLQPITRSTTVSATKRYASSAQK